MSDFHAYPCCMITFRMRINRVYARGLCMNFRHEAYKEYHLQRSVASFQIALFNLE